jgi:hypothetical protein
VYTSHTFFYYCGAESVESKTAQFHKKKELSGIIFISLLSELAQVVKCIT